MKNKLTKIAILIVLLTGCASPAEPTQDPAAIQATAQAMAWAAVTQTALAVPTVTLTPTIMPTPTNTPEPTATPAPIILEGAGDNVVDVPKGDEPMIAKVAYNGGSNFVIWNIDRSGNQMDLLVNTIGAYQGTLPIDFLDNEQTASFEIKADGAWRIELLTLGKARQSEIPSVIQGVGDDVIILINANKADLLKVDASTASSNFIVYQYSNVKDLIVNEIAPYTGTVPLKSDVVLLTIKATGPWQLEVTSR
jgi:hypothetical protein